MGENIRVTYLRDNRELTGIQPIKSYCETRTHQIVAPDNRRIEAPDWSTRSGSDLDLNQVHVTVADVSGDDVREMTRRYDEYFERPTAYMLGLHAAPRGRDKNFHFTAQFYPILRAPGRVKYLASVEQHSSVMTVDVMPEQFDITSMVNALAIHFQNESGAP